ncbi:hypothetical protein H4Q26_000324 [Puccinia striiformis f. sp. tritici PST-130]|nr:hypothetical protein H4Q26_000324 [Puccinia striiformis f. sp. tritici PST-130]
MSKPQMELLEELKAQLTQPAKKPLEAGATGHLHVCHDPTQLTSTALAVLLEEEVELDHQAGNRNEEVALALEVINLVFRKLKSTKRNSISSDSNSLPPEVLRQISRGIWVHWNAPSPTISYKIKNALKNLLEYMNNSGLDFRQSSSIVFFLESVKQSILLEKRSLSILSYLLPHLSSADALQAFQLFSASPREFLATILDAIADDKLASVVGQLAVHWTTKVEGWDLNISQPTNCSTNIHSNWISIVFSILFSSQERKRQYLCQYYLLPLFKNRPRRFTEIAGTLSLITGPRFDRLSLTDNPFDHLSGIIALARLNPRQSCSRSESNSHNGPWLPDTLLKVSLSHPAVSLRSSALAIICQSLAPTSRLSLPHLDLVLQFFTWNFGEVEAELKQNIFSNLNVFFNRLKDSSNSSKKKFAELISKKNSSLSLKNSIQTEEDPEVIRIQNMIDEAETYLAAVKSFIQNFLKLCRTNLTISSPYRCQMASLTYLQILLNTGVDSLYDLPTKKPCLNNAQEGHKPLNFPFEIEIMDSTLINDLILALTSTYVDVREAAFSILDRCSTLDSQFNQNSSRLIKQVLAYAMQCLDSNRESENSTASLLFRLVLKKSIVKNSQVSSLLLPRNFDQCGTTNPLATFLLGRLDDLKDRITESEINLGKACEERPVSGSIMLISELYKCLTTEMITSLVESKDLKAIMDQTKNLILRVWKLSAIVLCHSSERESEIIPDHEEARAYEFISAEEDGELLEDEGVLSDRNLGHRHKTILSACWRSMKEASALLMQTVKLSLMAEEQNLSENLGTFFSYEDLKQIGELFEQWLLEIRHRGAFGAIHASYSSLCDSLCSLPKKSIPSQLPVIWLQAHISAITSRKISTTRRSAGLPYCILSTCQALSKSNTNKLRDSLSTILSLAESQEISSEVQVHILNTLKILLTDGKVCAQFTSALIERSFDLAINSFVSSDWKVRNGALILFSGLTNRVFGTRSLSSDRCFNNLCKRESLSDFSRRLPTMASILLKELRRSIQAGTHLLSTSHSHGPMFAVLTLLALLQNPDGAPTAKEFIPLVRECLKSKVSKVRSIGADAMTGLIPCSQVPALICDLLTEAMKSPCHNQVHGLLLLINRLIQLPSTLSEDEKSKIQANLDSSASKFLHSKAIPLVTQSSFLEIIESLETRFNIKAEPTCLLTSDTMMDKVQEYRRIRAPALNSYETQATRHLLQRTQDREMVLRLLRVGSTATLITVFEFLGKAENRAILNDPEIIDVIFRFGRQSTHSISIRLPALKLLTIGSDLKAVSWPLEEIFMDYESSLAIPMRDTLLVLSGYFLVNSLGDPDSNHDNLSVRIWADKILDKIEGAAHEDQSTETRLSAVEGLTAFLKLFKSDDGVLSMKIKYRTLQLSISLIQDDDDEIRSSLTNSLNRTRFLSSTDPRLVKEDEDKFQLELVPNLILEKLITLSISLNPFFGFKKLLKRDDFQADLDQLFQPSDDLFVTERLNLYKDDFLEFDLVQKLSLEILNSNAEPDGELNAEEVKAEQDQKINQVFEDAELGQEIQTFKHLLDVLIPVSFNKLKSSDFSDGTILFRNLLNNKNKAESENDNEGKDEFNVISYKAWHSLILRLFNLIKIFQSFPRKSQHSILSSMVMLDNDDPSSVADISSLIQAQAQELDDRFLCLRNFLSSHY